MSVISYKNYSYLRGPKGDRGPKGEKGDRGPAGDSGILSATGRIIYDSANKIISFNSAGLATESYVDSAIGSLIDSAPTLLNTLNELAAALGDDPNFASSVVLKTGSTMTGFLTLSGNPTSALHAATKQYVDSSLSSLPSDTDALPEGSANLYYTTARANTDFDTRLATKTTTNLTEGTNLYYTSTRANTDFDTRLATKTTTDLTEGTNLYYTSTRARSAISASGSLSYDSSTGVISYTAPVLASVATSGNYSDLIGVPTDLLTDSSTLDGGTF